MANWEPSKKNKSCQDKEVITENRKNQDTEKNREKKKTYKNNYNRSRLLTAVDEEYSDSSFFQSKK